MPIHNTLYNGFSYQTHSVCRSFHNLRQSSLDGLTSRGYRSNGSHSAQGFFGRPRASSSETNLRKLAAMSGASAAAASAGYDLVNHRPGSALGLLQGNFQL